MEFRMSVANPPWAVAIFAARETPAVLAGTVQAAIAACAGRQATIDVLINGNHALAADFAELAATLPADACTLRVWSIAAPDKAHTWNEYVHRIWDRSGRTFFIDGYARVKPGALAAIDRRLAGAPNAMAGSGVPTCGRSATRLREHMLRRGGIHGNLYALTEESMDMIRTTGFRLPLGLYRTDPMLGAVLAYRLDPARHEWKRGTVVAEADATWDVDGIDALNYKNVIAYFKRRLRQAQGVLESRALREHMTIKRLAPQFLPRTAQGMISDWLAAQPAQARSLFLKQPSCLYAARKLRAPRDWSATEVAPVLLRTHGGASAPQQVELAG
jgi:hypothetical protein